MRKEPLRLRRFAVQAVALAVLAVIYGFARLPQPGDAELAKLAAGLDFERFVLSEPQTGLHPKTIRQVHPGLAHIAAWISSVGASVALNDLDGDGLANEVCYVDTRIDRIVVAPVPGTGRRFEPFFLEAEPLPYDGRTMAPMGCLPGDLDEDGTADVVAYYWGRTPVAFMNRGEGRALAAASFVPFEVTSAAETWFTNAATRADLDGDGHVDLVIGNYFPDNSAILDPGAEGAASMQHSMSRASNGGTNRLLRWRACAAEPGFVFDDVAGVLADEVAHGWTLSVGAADLDGDLLPEIYFGQDFGPDRLLHNRSRPGELSFELLEARRGFTTPSSKVLGHDSFKGMGVDFGDLNGDGWLDIYVSNIAEEYALEESHFVYVSTGEPELMKKGLAPYRDLSEDLGLSRSGWSWESRFADFNNDGVLEAVQATGFLKGTSNRWPELHEIAMGNDQMLSHPSSWHFFRPGDDLSGHLHNPFFVRTASGRYADLAPRLGMGDEQVSRGIATADVDGDGDLDFAVANQWESSYFYRNDSPASGASLVLDLRLPGDRPGRKSSPAIGAAASVRRQSGRQVAQVDGGNGHSGARSPELHFGLGEVDPGALLDVDVAWRDRAGRVHKETYQLAAGRHTLVLGEVPAKENLPHD